jgi:hypothetical protein
MRLKMRASILLMMPVLLTGCIVLPVPHVTKKSPRTLGKVVDDATSAPVDGAVVQLTTVGAWNRSPCPGRRTTTGADGRFELSSSYNFHLGLYANVSWAVHFPAGGYWEGTGLVTCAGYEPLFFHFSPSWQTESRDRTWVQVGELRLTRPHSTGTGPSKSSQD